MAQAACLGRRVCARPVGKLDFSGVGWRMLRTMLDWKWSSPQTAATLERVFPDETGKRSANDPLAPPIEMS
jgi:hypothetical protein